MFTNEMRNKIDKFLRENLDIMFEFEFNGLLLLYGGSVKGMIMDTRIKDYDFLILTQEETNLLDFFKKYDLKYEENYGHGYKFVYNDLKVGINVVNDLSKVCGYNTDALFYDIHRKQYIPIGVKQAIKERKVKIYEYNGYPRYECRQAKKRRLNNAKKFIQFMNNDNKSVKVVRKNKYFRRMIIGFLKHPSKIIKLFRR